MKQNKIHEKKHMPPTQYPRERIINLFINSKILIEKYTVGDSLKNQENCWPKLSIKDEYLKVVMENYPLTLLCTTKKIY